MRGRVTIRPLSISLLLRRIGLLLAISLLRWVSLLRWIARLLSVALAPVCAVGLAFYEFNPVADNLRYPLLLALLVVERTHLDPALDQYPVAFGQAVSGDFCRLSP